VDYTTSDHTPSLRPVPGVGAVGDIVEAGPSGDMTDLHLGSGLSLGRPIQPQQLRPRLV
jgi:hypothetical protein